MWGLESFQWVQNRVCWGEKCHGSLAACVAVCRFASFKAEKATSQIMSLLLFIPQFTSKLR